MHLNVALVCSEDTKAQVEFKTDSNSAVSCYLLQLERGALTLDRSPAQTRRVLTSPPSPAQLGCRWLKFLPSKNTSGAPALKSMLAPFGTCNLEIGPTGGISQ